MKQMRAIAAVFMATLREIFDEADYRRFLDRNGLTSSELSYAGFLKECEHAKARNPRCC